MARKDWTIGLDGFTHTVSAAHGRWSGGVTITVDGAEVVRSRSSAWSGMQAREFPIPLGGHDAYVRTSTNGFTYTHDLVVDGRSWDTGKVHGAYTPMPRWAWAFIILCGIVAKVGGLIGVPFGLGGAYACRRIARGQGDSVAMRAALCGAVTFTCWAAYIAVAVVLVGTVGRFR